MTTAAVIERKDLVTAVAVDATGAASGYASRFGSVDSYGDTIDKGAYAGTIPEFLSRGFIAWHHSWSDPVGYPTSAVERADGLHIGWKWHSDEVSQRRRQQVRERAEAGLFTGLSIGYVPEDYEYRQLGARKVRALRRIKLLEVSVVMVPAERNSGVGDAKAPPLDAQTRAFITQHLKNLKRFGRIGEFETEMVNLALRHGPAVAKSLAP
jgi:HK97 family phage prohead protease